MTRFGDVQSRQGVWHLRIEGKREKIRYIPLAIVAQRLITVYLAAAQHGDDTDGPLFRPVKNNVGKTLAKPLHKASVWDMIRLYTKQIGIAGTAPRLGVHAMRATAATMPWSMAPISPRCRSGWGMQISRRRGSMTSAAAGRRTVRPSRCAMNDEAGVMHWTVYILECADKTLSLNL